MRRLLLALAFLAIGVTAHAQVITGQGVSWGATCPPSISGSFTNWMYVCTSTGALYTWTGSEWVLSAAGETSAGGPNTSVQFNNGGVLAGDADFIWNATTNLLTNAGTLYQGPPAASFNSAIQSLFTGTANVIATLGDVVGTNIISQADGVLAFQTTALATAENGSAIGMESNSYIGGLNGDSFAYASYVEVLPGVAARQALGFYAYSTALGAGSSLTTNIAFYSGAQGGLGTNAYNFWADEQGVFRIRADNTFNSVYQAIPALYNPQFTKYTPGAVDYERCIPACQWNGNVAEVGNEKGGTGTLRDLRFIGQDIKPNPTGFFFLHQSVVTAAPAETDCDAAGETNRVVYDSTADNLYVCSGASGWRKIATAAP